MAKKSKKARRRHVFKRRMTEALARHGLTIRQAGRLPDSDLKRRRGIGPKMMNAIRTAVGPAATTARAGEEDETQDGRLAAVERQMVDLIDAVRRVQDLLRVQGIDRRAAQSSEETAAPDQQALTTDWPIRSE